MPSIESCTCCWLRHRSIRLCNSSRTLPCVEGLIRSAESIAERDKAIRKIVTRFRDLRVSPDIATATNYRKASHAEIEHAIERKFGDSLAEVAGFYLTDRWRLNLPESCAFLRLPIESRFYQRFPLSAIRLHRSVFPIVVL